ncbi:MAG: DedA family protein [bacterium]|nr:DedA family protein [bacterium]MCX8188257.1 DedA family protein [Nitrososphaeria archaeon]
MNALLDGFLDYVNAYLLPWGPAGLFILSFIEAIFFPIPPDAMLIPLVLLDPANGLFYGLVATISSVAGAVVGYYIGLKGGRPILKRFVSESKLKKVEYFYEKYGVLAVGIAAFTPIPFKVFTITAGLFRLKNFLGYIVASMIGRAARFLPESYLIMLYGNQILEYFFSQFELFTIILGIILIVMYIFLKYFNQKPK